MAGAASAGDLKGRHFVVTGANAGVGLATVRALAATLWDKSEKWVARGPE